MRKWLSWLQQNENKTAVSKTAFIPDFTPTEELEPLVEKNQTLSLPNKAEDDLIYQKGAESIQFGKGFLSETLEAYVPAIEKNERAIYAIGAQLLTLEQACKLAAIKDGGPVVMKFDHKGMFANQYERLISRLDVLLSDDFFEALKSKRIDYEKILKTTVASSLIEQLSHQVTRNTY